MRVLLAGMSGTGKSSVVRELRARGYKAVDTDDGWVELQPDGRQLWREDAIRALLAAEDADVLFVAAARRTRELRRVLEDVETVEPLLRRVATEEVRTTVRLNEVVTTILRLVHA